MNRLSKVIILVSIFIIGCKKEKSFPVTPVIAYKDFVTWPDSITGVLTFTFTDGDGDLGAESESADPNLFIDYYELENGNWKQIFLNSLGQEDPNGDPVKFEAIIPYVDIGGEPRAIEGEIAHNFSVAAFYTNSTNDTFRYVFYIKDRAGNKSNVVTTPDLIKLN